MTKPNDPFLEIAREAFRDYWGKSADVDNGWVRAFASAARKGGEIGARLAIEQAAKTVELMGMAEEDMPQPSAEWLDAWRMAAEAIRALAPPTKV